jgi:hypothetical protein
LDGDTCGTPILREEFKHLAESFQIAEKQEMRQRWSSPTPLGRPITHKETWNSAITRSQADSHSPSPLYLLDSIESGEQPRRRPTFVLARRRFAGCQQGN